MKMISLCGFYGKKNIGDDELQKNITCFFQNLGYSIKVHKENDLNFNEIVVIGGGGLVTPKFFAFKRLDRLKDKKVILFNVNLTEESKPLLLSFKQLNILFIVRDRWSVNYLNINGFKEKVLYAPDICFNVFKNLRRVNNQKIAAINCNYYCFAKIFSDNYLERLNAERSYAALQQLSNWLISFGWHIRLVPAQISKSIDDRVTNYYLHGLLNNKSQIMYDNNIIKNLCDVSLLISSRYHLSVYALSNYIPLLNINFHSKSENLFHDLNLPECCLNYYDLTKEKLINATINIENNKNYKNKIDTYRVKGKEDWNKTIDQIKQFLYEQEKTK